MHANFIANLSHAVVCAVRSITDAIYSTTGIKVVSLVAVMNHNASSCMFTFPESLSKILS